MSVAVENAVAEGYHVHWFNDVAGRIDDARAAGFRHVCEPNGDAVRKSVGVTPRGHMYSVAMKIEKDRLEAAMQAMASVASVTAR